MSHQSLVIADADDPAVVQHHNLIRAQHGADALGDHDHAGVCGAGRERPAQRRVGRIVQGRERVVEDVDEWVLGDGPRDGQPLPLATGNVGAALLDRHRQPVGMRGDELLALGNPQRLPEVLVAGVRGAEPQVLGDRPTEEEGLLRDEPDQLPQVAAAPPTDIRPIDADAAAGHVVQAGDEVHQGGLAGAGGSDDCGGAPGLGRERDVVQHRGRRARVSESDVFELDQPGRPFDLLRGLRDRRSGRWC